MPRVRSEKISTLKAKLIAKIRDGFHRPGDRFLSARAVADRYGVSYQTAHWLIQELEEEGLVERRAASGTYVAGKPPLMCGVELCFHERAKRDGSFGASLLEQLQSALRDAGITATVNWSGNPAPQCYPVLWEAASALSEITRQRRYALLLNDLPAPGMEASLVDAIATNDFSAGVCAAQVLRNRLPNGKQHVVVAGPADDQRSCRRVDGFKSIFPLCKVIRAGGWYFEDGTRVAARVLKAGKHGVFCVNDRLAEGVMDYARRSGFPLPPLIGHDNAPVAEALHLTTIALPWPDIVSSAVGVIRARIVGDSSPARQIILAQRPICRLTA